MIQFNRSTSPPTAATNPKSSPTESLRKVSSINGRTYLPRTIAATQSISGKKMPSYSTQKFQNDVKHHSSYLSVFHPKPIANPKPASTQQQSPPSSLSVQQHQQLPPPPLPARQINSSYTRLTNKLNCCKSFVRDSDAVSISKLKNDCKCPSQFNDSNGNGSFETELQPKYKFLIEARRSTIPGALPRKSIDANSVLRKSKFKRSLDDDLLNVGDFRHNPFDEKTIQNVRHLKKLTPPQLDQSDSHNHQRSRNGNYLSQSIGKHITASNCNRRLIKQKSLDDYTDATARLRKLEVKMRKPKIDILKYANNHDQSTIYTDPKKLLAYPSTSSHFRSRLEPFARAKADCVYPKIGVESVLQIKTQSNRKNGTNGGSYGIITSTELYKLRGTPEHVT